MCICVCACVFDVAVTTVAETVTLTYYQHLASPYGIVAHLAMKQLTKGYIFCKGGVTQATSNIFCEINLIDLYINFIKWTKSRIVYDVWRERSLLVFVVNELVSSLTD